MLNAPESVICSSTCASSSMRISVPRLGRAAASSCSRPAPARSSAWHCRRPAASLLVPVAPPSRTSMAAERARTARAADKPSIAALRAALRDWHGREAGGAKHLFAELAVRNEPDAGPATPELRAGEKSRCFDERQGLHGPREKVRPRERGPTLRMRNEGRAGRPARAKSTRERARGQERRPRERNERRRSCVAFGPSQLGTRAVEVSCTRALAQVAVRSLRRAVAPCAARARAWAQASKLHGELAKVTTSESSRSVLPWPPKFPAFPPALRNVLHGADRRVWASGLGCAGAHSAERRPLAALAWESERILLPARPTAMEAPAAPPLAPQQQHDGPAHGQRHQHAHSHSVGSVGPPPPPFAAPGSAPSSSSGSGVVPVRLPPVSLPPADFLEAPVRRPSLALCGALGGRAGGRGDRHLWPRVGCAPGLADESCRASTAS